MQVLLTIMLMGLSLFPARAAASGLGDAATDGPRHDYEFNYILKDNLTFRTNAAFVYRHSKALSSRLTLLYETFAIEDELEGFPGSSRREKTKELILDVYALEYTLAPLTGLSMTLGLSFDLFFQQTSERGDFLFGESQVYDNSYSALFLSGKLSLQTQYKRERFAVTHQLEAIPVYYYSFAQDISILPLVPTGVERNQYRDLCTPFFKNDLRLAFRFIELHGIHEYQNINFTLLNIVPTEAGEHAFEPVQSSYYISNFLFMLHWRIPLLQSLDLVLGTGVKTEKTYDRQRRRAILDRHQWLATVRVASPLFD